MTPASSLEILLAKMIPTVVIILGDVCLAVYASHLIFGMPCRGSLAVLLMAGETLGMVSDAMMWLAISAAVILTLSAHRFSRQLQ